VPACVKWLEVTCYIGASRTEEESWKTLSRRLCDIPTMIQISMAIGRRLLEERCDQLRWNGCGSVVCCDFDGSFVEN
jgi:hypothetical protein